MLEESGGELGDSFETLLADGERRLDAVDAALDEIGPRYRSRSEDRSYTQFIEALRLANTAVRRRLEGIRDDRNSLEIAYESLRSLLGSFPIKQERLVWALQADRAEALEVFAQPFTRLAKALLPNVEILFFSWAREAFEISIYDVERANDLTGGAAASLKREFGEDIQFLQLWHPKLRETALFQHAVFGHELGHPAIRQHPPEQVREELGAGPDSTYAAAALDAALRSAERKGVSFPDEDEQKLVKWFDEIACDLIGMRLFGPAFAMAFIEATSVNRYLKRQKSTEFRMYPPPRLRVEFLRRELGNWHLGSREAELRPTLEHLVSVPAGLTDAEEDIPGSTEVLRNASSLFSEVCLPHLLQDHALDPGELCHELEDIWALLDLEVPPAERILVTKESLPAGGELSPWSVEFEWRSILNGVALWLLDHVDGMEPSERAAEKVKAVQVATGAIEMAEFQRRARVLRAEFEQIGGREGR